MNICYSKIKIYTFLKNQLYPLLQNQKTVSNASSILSLLLEIEKNISDNETTIYNLVSNSAPKLDGGVKVLKGETEKLNSKIEELTNLCRLIPPFEGEFNLSI